MRVQMVAKNIWSDEAIEASLEARRKSSVAKRNKLPAAHSSINKEAMVAHNKAAKLAKKDGDEKAAIYHKNQAAKHKEQSRMMYDPYEHGTRPVYK